MRRRTLTVLLAPLLALLAGCATTPPVRPATTPVASPVASSASATPTPTPTPTPTDTATPTPTPSPAEVAPLELRGDGLGDYAFGAKQADVTALLEDVLGDPDESAQGIKCELDDSSPWAQTVMWGDFWVEYDAKDTSKKSPRTLAAWGLTVDAELPESVVIQDDVPLDASFAQLKAAYPSGKTEDLGFGDGSKRFILPNKIFFVGAGARPDRMQSGAFGTCE